MTTQIFSKIKWQGSNPRQRKPETTNLIQELPLNITMLQNMLVKSKGFFSAPKPIELIARF